MNVYFYACDNIFLLSTPFSISVNIIYNIVCITLIELQSYCDVHVLYYVILYVNVPTIIF